MRGWPLYLAIGVMLMLGTTAAVVTYRGSRGLRNNNPGNIRKDGKTDWLGSVSELNGTEDTAFVQFKAPEYGIRAMARILNSYARAGIVKVSDVIARWAPPSENDTKAYEGAVLRGTGWLPGRRLTKADYPILIATIIRQENGSQPYPADVIRRGIDLA